MIAMFRSEWIKLRKTVIWLLAGVSPLIAAGIVFLEPGEGMDSPWLPALGIMSVLHAMLFLPLLTGVFAALLCRHEHIGGGWKQLLALPVSRLQVYVIKFVYVMLLVAFTQLLFVIVLLLIGTALGFSAPIPWSEIARSVAGGWVACLPLAALQLAVSTAWPSFAAPLAVNVIFTIPNILITNSAEYGPYYPWAQPMLAMIPRGGEMSFGAFNVTPETLFLVILGSFVLFGVSGYVYFARKAI
ncbi:ABC transporter permease [Paenibacillus flagellatus]|uniref:ABC transporter permease n=1 Tax=Paenibacillus flagellatus TaxID=2211139 RepID=A0A2V5K3D6_9BACL|nr:ABC transporter permease [Paenibacillus flagellatus]PYI53749.1 hypothetical protein DLM86_14365 [Paenibacillus flagellatus]